MTSVDKNQLLNQWHTERASRCAIIDQFRTDRPRATRFSESTTMRQIVCYSVATIFFLASFSPVLAAPFNLEPPDERLIPEQVRPDISNSSGRTYSNGQQGMMMEEEQQDNKLQQTEPTTKPKIDNSDSKQVDIKTTHPTTSTPTTKPSNSDLLAGQQTGSTSKNTIGQPKDYSQKENSLITSTDDGGKLPQTATNSWSHFLQGISFILLGCALWKRKKTANS